MKKIFLQFSFLNESFLALVLKIKTSSIPEFSLKIKVHFHLNLLQNIFFHFLIIFQTHLQGSPLVIFYETLIYNHVQEICLLLRLSSSANLTP